MEDKILKLRNEHPILDFIAGFVPGVGEAQDVLDFTHAASKGDMAGMGLASLGLIIPGLTGGLIGKALKLAKKSDIEDVGGLGNAIKKEVVQQTSDTLKPIVSELSTLAKKVLKNNPGGYGWLPFEISPKDAKSLKIEIRKEPFKPSPEYWEREGDLYRHKVSGKYFAKVFIKDPTGQFHAQLEPIEQYKNHLINFNNRYKEDLLKLDPYEAVKNGKTLKKHLLDFNKEAEEFRKKYHYDFGTDSWQQGVPKELRMNIELLDVYTTRTGKELMNHLKDLYKKGEKHDGKSYAVRLNPEGSEYAYLIFIPVDKSLNMAGKLKDKFAGGLWRNVNGSEFEYYMLATSPRALKNLYYTGLPMFRGINNTMFEALKNGSSQGWFTNVANNTAPYLINPKNKKANGYSFMAAPVREADTSLNRIDYFQGYRPNASSNHYGTLEGKDAIIGHIPEDKDAVHITPIPLTDDLLPRAGRGFWTVLGDNKRIKILKGGTGLYDINELNPFLRKGGIIGIKNIRFK